MALVEHEVPKGARLEGNENLRIRRTIRWHPGYGMFDLGAQVGGRAKKGDEINGPAPRLILGGPRRKPIQHMGERNPALVAGYLHFVPNGRCATPQLHIRVTAFP
jgi:hypothetical protein